MSEVVGVGCEIHIPSVSLDVLSALLKVSWKRISSRRAVVDAKMATVAEPFI